MDTVLRHSVSEAMSFTCFSKLKILATHGTILTSSVSGPDFLRVLAVDTGPETSEEGAVICAFCAQVKVTTCVELPEHATNTSRRARS